MVATAFADIGLERRLETAKCFTELAEVATKPVDDEDVRQVYEKVAAIYVIAAFA